MWKGLFCAGALLALLPAGAHAQTINPKDRHVVVEDAGVAAALKQTAGMASIPEATMRVIGPILYRDNMLTPNESDLILELLDAKTRVTIVTSPLEPAFTVPPLSAPAHDFLALHDPPDLNTLWLAGPKEMKKLVDVTVLNPHVIPQVENFFGMNLFVSWRTSVATKNNRYIRETLTAALNQFRLSGPETERLGRRMLYHAMLAVDEANKNAIPNDIYLYLRTPAAAAATPAAAPATK